jgi:hypothetical protein
MDDMSNMQNRKSLEWIVSQFLVLFFVSWVVVRINWGILHTEFYPVLDYATDMLWANLIKEGGPLLVGHYSRFDFNHPGPFWFYWNMGWEYVLGFSSLTRFQIWVIGSLFINVFNLVCAGWALSHFLLGGYRAYVLVVVLSATLLLASGDTFGLWMPLRLITTYIAFWSVLLSLLKGNTRFLPWVVLFGGMLFHGYVTTVVAVFPLTIVLIGLAFWLRRSQLTSRVRKIDVIFSASIILLFLAPIAWDILHSGIPNIGRILNAQHALASMPKPSWLEVWNFYRDLVVNQKTSIVFYCITSGALICTLLIGKTAVTIKIVKVFLLFLVNSICLLLYYKNTPAPLYAFTAQYFIGATVVLVSCIWSSFISLITTHVMMTKKAAKWLLVPSLLLLLVTLDQFVKRNEIPEIPDMQLSRAIPTLSRSLVSQFDRPIRIDHTDPSNWGLAAGLLLQIKIDGGAACITKPEFSFLYTSRLICKGVPSPDVLIVDSERCTERCLAKAGKWGLQRMSTVEYD